VLHHESLFGKFSATLTNSRKDELWIVVLEKVNAVSPILRTLDEIKKKYQALKKDVKAKEAHNRREILETGGGSADLKSQDEVGSRILSTIPCVAIEAVSGGFDSSGN
jgi:hypothetical protein